MVTHRHDHIRDFLAKVKAANKEATKKEAFKDLLNRIFGSNEDTRGVIDAITAGAEMTVLNIPRKDKKHRGSADTLYHNIIIEFENDLRKTLSHAKQQLAGYLLGQVHSREGYNFTLIASDFVTWKVFAPDVSQLDSLESLTEDELKLNEVETASFTLSEDKIEDFYYWIDRFLFKEEKQKATLERIEERFGYQSPIFIQCFREMSKNFREVKETGDVNVSFDQWKKFLSIAYSSFVSSDHNFLTHTYLSVFAKMLAYEFVSNDEYIDDDRMAGILNGSIFKRYGIDNFVENDFFHWVISNHSFSSLKKSFRLIAQELSTFDFFNVDEDILKGIYQEMIDLDTRHALGEYYTPDWLCERIVSEFNFGVAEKVLDPACGSGSFLRAVVNRARQLHPELSVEVLNDNVYGIDIHPLSVQIAKTTLLLALGSDVVHVRRPIHLNVVLANTLLAPRGVEKLYGDELQMQIGERKYSLSSKIFANATVFDRAVSVADELADLTRGQEDEQPQAFESILARQIRTEINTEAVDSFYQVYRALKIVKESGKDTIWKFIVQNLYKPYFLSRKFDYVVGNPPWFTYSSIRNETYQNLLSALATEYKVKPQQKANLPHLEIAAIFLAYCTSYFLKNRGRIAFVLPRSFFSADHHDNTRSGKARGLRLDAAWDLQDVSPLFRIPSCVLFGEKSALSNEIATSGLPGREFSGRLPNHNCNWAAASASLSETRLKFYYVKQGKSSALASTKLDTRHGPNPYKKEFKQGATIVPRAFYFIDMDQEIPPDYEDRTINVRTSPAIQADAKRPWDEVELKGQIESRFLYKTALAKSVLPFALFKPALIVLPITVDIDKLGRKRIALHSASELRKAGSLLAARWFRETERIWEERKTAKSKRMTNLMRLNFQKGLTDQDLNIECLVLYNSSAQDANAVVVTRKQFDLEFIVESVAYVYYAQNVDEAYYLTAILNSAIPNERMKQFQARGLWGARHVHRKILDVFFPRFTQNDHRHLQLSQLSRRAHELAQQFLRDNPPTGPLTPHRLGRLRVEVKTQLNQEMGQIDSLLSQILT